MTTCIVTKLRAALLAAAVGILASAGLSLATPAQAEAEACSGCAPWWGLGVASRPTDIRPGAAKSAVQRLSVQGSEGEFVLSEPIATERGELFNEKGEPEFVRLPFNAEAREVQEGLEAIYGAGNVEVTGGPVGRPARVEGEPYTITFTKALGNQFVEPVATSLSGAGGFSGTIEVTPLVLGRPDGQIVVMAENRGDAIAHGEVTPIAVRTKIPAGLEAVAMSGRVNINGQNRGFATCNVEQLECDFDGELFPYQQLEVVVSVVVSGAGASSGAVTQASVEGGGAGAARTLERPLHSGAGEASGVEEYNVTSEEPEGRPDSRAGSHPFQLTTTLNLDQALEQINTPQQHGIVGTPAALPKDFHFKLPPGLVGNPTPFSQCTDAQFGKLLPGGRDECSPRTALGVATVTFFEPNELGLTTDQVPVFNLAPLAGEPARFGLIVDGALVTLDVSVRTGSDYGVTVNVDNVSELVGIVASDVTIWGVPGDPRHDTQRGWACLKEDIGEEVPGESCDPENQQHPLPFLSLPTICAGALQSSAEEDTWQDAGVFTQFGLTEPMVSLVGCNHLPFTPGISVAPDVTEASAPTGLTVDVHFPLRGEADPAGVVESTLKNTTVALPEGVTVNPAGAGGLEACSEGQIGYLGAESAPSEDLLFTPGLPTPFCPNGAKVGTVEIETPLLPNPLKGGVYLASQEANPFGSLIALYLVAQDPVSGTLVKLAGHVSLNEQTGQVVTSFNNAPPLPFANLRLHFFEGARAALSTPARCGAYAASAAFAPWSGEANVTASPGFTISSGPGGKPCTGVSPFAPSLAAGTSDINAGAFSPLTTSISREDGEQQLQSVQLHFPAGVSGILTGVKLCHEAEANAGSCGQESLIGHSTASVGVGDQPYTVTGGEVFLTESYQGAPFGVSIVTPAVAGPFNLGKVVVRGKVEVDPRSAALTVSTGTIPHILDGIPLDIKRVNVTIDRPHFSFNPTNCDPLSIDGGVSSVEGAQASLGASFQLANCAVLKFTPKIAVSTAGHGSKPKGTSLHFKISYPAHSMGSQAWFEETKIDLPKQLPARNTTLQQACLAHVFEIERARCPAGSKIGTATVHTPVLPVPLTGPIYFVSYGGAKFPEAVFVLKGYGVTIELHGETFISKAGITSATFRNTPDVPFENIEVAIPAGRFSEFGINLPEKDHYDLCGHKLSMPTLFKAQNGLEIHQNTPISVTGCPKAHKKSKAHKLAAALKACHKKHGRKRAQCEKAARRKYGPVKKRKRA